jgi:chromosome transmission fidelity protein 4
MRGRYWHRRNLLISVRTDIQMISRNGWQEQRAFSGGHDTDITALAWSANGAVLASVSQDKTLVLWETRRQKILKTFNDVKDPILNLRWHPSDNILSYTTSKGELFIRYNIVPQDYLAILHAAVQPAAPENLSNVTINLRKEPNGVERPAKGYERTAEDDYLDDLLGPDAMSEDGDADGFIEDDDGAGYAEEPNPNGKRSANAVQAPRHKRQAMPNIWQPHVHPPFQTGSTPWRGNRRYLCLNLVGFVWTQKQDLHNTVTVEFYDRQEHRDFHFTDPYLYDKACLNDKGTLFSCPSSSRHPATIYYRPHETWTARVDWRIQLPVDEEVTSMSLSESCIVVTTTASYTRVYSLYGVPLKVYRQKSTPAVTCASWRDYVMTVGNGPVGSDGSTRLLYTIENVKRDETYQSEDILALPEGVELRCVTFSEKGDPCIYDSTGVLLILQHWRRPGQAKWVPLLDTRALKRLEGGRKDENYWPVAVANDRFYCIILKGGEQYPYFPRPLHSDFEFQIPLAPSGAGEEDEDKELAVMRGLEEQYVRNCLQYSLLSDLVENTNATSSQRAAVGVMEREVDKVLLQLLAAECREGEERGMKALELATLMKDRTGQMLEAAGKVASRFRRDILGDKIKELAERRLVGLVNEDEM